MVEPVIQDERAEYFGDLQDEVNELGSNLAKTMTQQQRDTAEDMANRFISDINRRNTTAGVMFLAASLAFSSGIERIKPD